MLVIWHETVVASLKAHIFLKAEYNPFHRVIIPSSLKHQEWLSWLSLVYIITRSQRK